jgi:hypothetical protein
MAIGRITGSVLKSNLTRNGTDLAFETNLLYLDVTNSRVGIGTSEPTTALQVNGTITATALAVTDDVTLANNKKVIFGDPAENIVGDGTRITISSSNSITFDATTDIILDADGEGGGGGGDIIFKDAGLEYGRVENNSGNIAIANKTSNTWYNIIEASGNNDLTMPGNVTVGGTIEAANFKQEGTNFTGSLLIGHSTTGTLNAATYNTGVGLGVLDALTSGDSNTALGHNALSTNTIGGGNTAIGRDALLSNNNGGDLTAVGFQALRLNSGSNSTAVGKNALVSNSTGSKNTALGVTALGSVAAGDGNIGIGYTSGNNITSGSGNVVIGVADVASATGDKQFKISDGEDGSVVWLTGDSSGNLTTVGDVTLANDKKVIFGDAGEHIAGDGTSLVITASNQLHLMPAGRLGIGTTSPAKQVQIAATASNQPFLRIETTDGGNKRLDLSVQGGHGVIEARQSAQNLILDATSDIIFKNNGTETARMRSAGLAIGGTGDANTLDDYEEGTWTPGLTIASSGNSGTYTKIGNLVFARFKVIPTASGSNIRITGLPFTSTGATTGEQQGGSRETETSGKFYFIRVSNNSTEASIIRYDANVSFTSSQTFEGQAIYLTT